MTTAVPQRLRAATRTALDRALARADVYRVLAGAFDDPDDPTGEASLDLATLRAAARELGTQVGAATWRSIAGIVERDARTVEHRRIFGHVVAHGCPPYETEWGRRHVFGQSQDLGDIRGFYEAFGVRPRRGGERPDHLACELEFLSLLAIKEAMALAAGDADRVEICRGAASHFLEDHPGRWVVALAARIAGRAPRSGYAAAAALAATILGAHAREIGAAPRLLEPDDLLPVTGDADGFAFECGLDLEAGDLGPPGAAP